MMRRTVTSPLWLTPCVVLVMSCLASVLPLTAAFADWTITDLGVLPGGTYSSATGINDSGQVVGYGDTTDSPNGRAFLYDATGMHDLGVLSGGSASSATGINHSGQVVGYSNIPGDDPSLAHAFLYSSGAGMTDLGVFPGGSSSYATGINNSGQVVGFGDTWDTPDTGYYHAFSYSSGGSLTDLGVIAGGFNSWASGINALGQVVGMSDSGAGPYPHAFLSDGTGSPGSMADLGVPSGFVSSAANGINAGGLVAGVAWDSGGGEHAFLYSGTQWRDLGVLPGLTASYASGINAGGQVVGYSNDYNDGMNDGYTAFLYSGTPGVDGAMVDLNSFVTGTGWTLNFANAINDKGQIVGTGTINGQDHAFLLTDQGTGGGATPELPPIALVGALPLGLAWLRRRRVH